MKHSRKSNPQAITLAVGQFLKETRNGKKVSMYNILLNNGVHSAYRAKTLVRDLYALGVIKKHRDGSITVEKNMLCEELMPKLLNKPRKLREEKHNEVPAEVLPEEVVNPLEYFTSQDLVTELRNRGYAVTCAREVITIETL